MELAASVELALCWIVWWYPFLFRAPHKQSRASITVPGPTRIGLLLETAAIFMAFLIRLPPGHPPGLARILLSMAIAPPAVLMAWSAVTHLGRQFRITAGLYHDHELVHTGAYAIVRHPIYCSLLAMLLSTLLLLTPWPWAVASVIVFIIGTEIRVRTEDRLLASRFGPRFDEYRRKVAAYIPGIR